MASTGPDLPGCSALEEIRTPNLLIRSYLAFSVVLARAFPGGGRAKVPQLEGVENGW